MSHPPILEAHSLTRRYGDLVAVDNLDLSIPAGAIYALLGPNGAGKTTTIAMLTTLLPPTSGSACVAGYDIVRAAADVRRRIGVTFQESVLDQDLTGREVLDYRGRLYGMSARERRIRTGELVELVELEEAADRLVKTYSGGMKRRLELARGLMTDPDVLFLDEPTQGLDPQNRARVWEYLHSLRARRGLTIVLTTHDMVEADTLADTVGIIDRGQLVVEGVPSELVARLGADVIRITGRGDAGRLIAQARKLAFVQQATSNNGLVQIGVDHGNRRLAQIVTLAAENDYAITDISVARPSLGDVFLDVTGHTLRDR